MLCTAAEQGTYLHSVFVFIHPMLLFMYKPPGYRSLAGFFAWFDLLLRSSLHMNLPDFLIVYFVLIVK